MSRQAPSVFLVLPEQYFKDREIHNMAKQQTADDFPDCDYVKPARAIPDLVEDVEHGLLRNPKTLPPKYFYDDRGSRLFDAICDTTEYYPTRTEDALLRQYADDIIALSKPQHLVELGSGAARKTRRLFDACEQQQCHSTYWPFDVCKEMVIETATELQEEYHWLEVNGLVGDYHGGFDHFPDIQGRTLYAFLGSTIGNFEHADAVNMLEELSGCMSQGDYLLLGADRVKDVEVLQAAYNDRQGTTAEFNLNVLRVLNNELDADFDLRNFDHKAIYNREQSRIEMHLVSKCEQQVTLGALNKSIDFLSDESIMTEISRKFTPDSLHELLNEAGFELVEHFQPDNGYFSLVLARAA
jgi:L-histidine N-alpha-methyltransferase